MLGYGTKLLNYVLFTYQNEIIDYLINYTELSTTSFSSLLLKQPIQPSLLGNTVRISNHFTSFTVDIKMTLSLVATSSCSKAHVSESDPRQIEINGNIF